MVYMLRLFAWGVLVCAAVFALRTACAVAVSPATPLRTELILPLVIARLHEGSVVLVRVDSAWTGSGCTLRAGSIVKGHVVALRKRAKGVKDSEIKLAFDAADCEGHHERAFPFQLVAVIGFEGTRADGQSGLSEAPPLAHAMGSGMKSAASLPAVDPRFSQPVRQLPAHILPGQVLGVRKIVLDIGTGKDGASTLEALGHDLHLEQGTNFILTHEAMAANPGVETTSSGGAPVSARADTLAPSAPPGEASKPVPLADAKTEETAEPHQRLAPVISETLDETLLCTGPCHMVAEPAIKKEVADSAAAASIPLAKLGYLPGNNRERPFFNYDTVLTYLDRRDLLCTFDPRYLRHRAGWQQESVRTIKAVLIDAETHRIQQVMDWRVQGAQQYLWRLAPGRLLVHKEGELRELDAQLRTIHSIPTDGEVAWVASSPSGDTLAVGVVRERYSQAVKRELEAALSAVPEEDVEVRVFNKERRLIATAVQSSTLPSPVLTDAGELRLSRNGTTHWKIGERRWDGAEHPIATTNSTCMPVLSTPARGMIFAVGCTSSGGRWYRMLRENGHPLLKGESASDVVALYAEGVDDKDFAVRTVRANRSMAYEQPFRRADLLREQIAIYSSRNGAKLLSVTTRDFILAQLAFALSPSGDQLALIGNNSVLFYPVPVDRN